MSFNNAYQPFLTDDGVLALSCQDVAIDSVSVGMQENATFTVNSQLDDIYVGYPKKLHDTSIKSIGATANVELLELGGICKTLLQAIAASINTEIVPTKDLDLTVFKPRSTDLVIGLPGAALLQQFNLTCGNDFNRCKFYFEQLVSAGQTLQNTISLSNGSAAASSPNQLEDKNNISIGFPKIGTLVTLQAASLNLTTQYKRIEVGYPKTLYALIPVSHELILEADSEDFSSSAVSSLLTLGTQTALTFTAALYDGSAVTITLPKAFLVPNSINLPNDNWATTKKTFKAYGTSLFTVS